jgi:hypothetical protein
LSHPKYPQFWCFKFAKSHNIKFFLKEVCCKIQFFWYNFLQLKTDIANYVLLWCNILFFYYVSSDSLFLFPQFIYFTKVENIFWKKILKLLVFQIAKILYLTHNLDIWNSGNLRT